jgi:hypothetical protein
MRLTLKYCGSLMGEDGLKPALLTVPAALPNLTHMRITQVPGHAICPMDEAARGKDRRTANAPDDVELVGPDDLA